MRMLINNRCKHCGHHIDGGDIYAYFLTKEPSEAQALERASNYGWCREAPLRFSKAIGIYDMEKDLITHYECPRCKEILTKKEATPMEVDYNG